ncbi:hypothetical protein K4K61_001769 [Colletotrichum sp. SAR11_59]|uniref:Uncharacterized protein n=1 Tax=Colletotrichum asianum TaxID=702518 RepID=A0A8H3W366_9PEZI|nr:hypothetical protein GQ607_015340 [Colletotrichum asianum]KAI8315427.1 hypothetical protein K4K61_001769 [Colletotrichum sp. SAR11_59]
MPKNKKSQQARRHAKRLKRLEMKALSEGDLHLSKSVGPNENHDDGLHSQDASSSPVKMNRLARLKVANRARKNINLNMSFLRRDVRQFKDTTSSEIKEKFADFEEKMRVQLYSFFDAKMQQEWSINDMKRFMASQEAHMCRQAREMDKLRSDNYALRLQLENERENREAMRNELRHDVDKSLKDSEAAMKMMTENPKDRTRGSIKKAQSDEGSWKGRLRRGVRG